MSMIRELRIRLERCLQRSEPTSPQLADLQQQLELCREEIEGIHSTVHRLSTAPPVAQAEECGVNGIDANQDKLLKEPRPTMLGAVPKQRASALHSGKCHASEIRTDKMFKDKISQPKLNPTMQFPSHEQQRLAHARSSQINCIISEKQTISQPPLIPSTITQQAPLPQQSVQNLSKRQPSGQQFAAQQPTMQQPQVPESVHTPSVQQFAVQRPSMQKFSMQQPQLQDAVYQPLFQQFAAQQQSMQQPQVPEAVYQPLFQQFAAQQQSMQQPQVPESVHQPSVQQFAAQQLSMQQPQVPESVHQPSVQQFAAQQLSMQQPQVPESVHQPSVQQFAAQQLSMQQPQVPESVHQPSVQQFAEQLSSMQPSTQTVFDQQPEGQKTVYQQYVQPPLVQQVPAYQQQFLVNHPPAGGIQEGFQTPSLNLRGQERAAESLPTQQQLTSRQSLARDLPTFTGEPAEWPIFISNFEYTTRTCGYTNGENMVRLQRCLRGRALDGVRSRLVFPAAVPQVIETLRMRYGRPELLIDALLQKVRSMPVVRGDKLEALIEYGMAVQEFCDHIEAANERAHLSNPTLLQELVGKLPADQKLMWAGYKRGRAVVDLKTFSEYMTGVVQDASSVVLYKSDPGKTTGREKTKAYVNWHVSNADRSSTPIATQQKTNVCLHCDKEGHKLRECQSFKTLSVDDRWRRIRALNVCQICLFAHGRRACRNSNKCNVSGCQFKHHPLLHGKSTTPTTQVINSHTHRLLDGGVLFRIIPVTLYGKSGSVNTFAFLDEGSSSTLINGDLVAQLGLVGELQPICLRWTGNTSRVEKTSQTVTITISGQKAKRCYKLIDAHTVENLNLPVQSFQAEEATTKFAHLKHLPIQSYRNARPEVLIGVDNLKLAVPLKTREGNGSGPVAAKTRLGWCVYGRQNACVNETFSFHICECTKDDVLHETVKQFFAVEENGIKHPVDACSAEDERARELLEKTTKRVGRRFETGLLWKDDEVEFPDSYSMALRRHQCLQRRMEKNPTLRENISRQIQEYVEKGYAHRATPADLENANPRRVWFLPLGAVTNPHKPGKVRLVWDAAAKVSGVSLNSALLKGPDQLTLLPTVMFRFRLYAVAVSADIEQMFHQLGILPADRNSLRFLWSETSDKPAEIYLMDVATFGATCSPASAQYVKNLNAKEHILQYPRAVEGILKSHYVDDYLDSFGTESEAVNTSTEVRLVHHNGGFHLRNWRSNSEKVVKELGNSATIDSKNLCLESGERVDRVLGMLWSSSSDALSFSTRLSEEVRNLLDDGSRPTKRQVLRCVMSLFDPLGLLALFIIHGKVLIQELWRAQTEWDEAVSDDVFEQWNRWIGMIEFIATVKIPRCYFSQATIQTYKNAQLHAFVDASEIAYACAVYIRTYVENGMFNCALISGKAKVAPLKPMSIPRLELQGCVLGARLLKFVQDNHPVVFSKRFLWTDSTTARSWIRSDPRRYKPFVAHRVGEILEITDVSEWRWVPSKLNPADEVTKWGRGPYFSPDSQWFHGPRFLRLPEGEWPKATDSVEATNEDTRTSVMLHFVFQPILDFERFSSWKKIMRTMVYVLRFLRNIAKPKRRNLEALTQEELSDAQCAILKIVQRECYPEEMAILESKGSSNNNQVAIDRKSSLFKLMPAMDETGLVRQRSRIIAAKEIAYDTRFPIILPSKHRAVSLLIEDYHRRYLHANNETIVNELRQRYNIPKLRQLVKNIAYKCQLCRIRKARPSYPPMATLPPARLATNVRPFSYVGVDYLVRFLRKLVGRM
ncbi:uncharacterized protein LOC134209563 [Armigeres subalbatus]|uniref:uncharacterized protein LOC134209563 n=1 Tax=Armigeres subalbatus TaxID=124917 RepID=UPI002ED15622